MTEHLRIHTEQLRASTNLLLSYNKIKSKNYTLLNLILQIIREHLWYLFRYRLPKLCHISLRANSSASSASAELQSGARATCGGPVAASRPAFEQRVCSALDSRERERLLEGRAAHVLRAARSRSNVARLSARRVQHVSRRWPERWRPPAQHADSSHFGLFRFRCWRLSLSVGQWSGSSRQRTDLFEACARFRLWRLGYNCCSASATIATSTRWCAVHALFIDCSPGIWLYEYARLLEQITFVSS